MLDLSTPFPLSFVVTAGVASEVSKVVCIESDFDFDTNVGNGSGNWKKNNRSWWAKVWQGARCRISDATSG